MWELGEILAVQTNINHIEGVLVIEVRNIWDFATNYFILVITFRANPILIALIFDLFLWFSNTGSFCNFEADCYTVNIV